MAGGRVGVAGFLDLTGLGRALGTGGTVDSAGTSGAEEMWQVRGPGEGRAGLPCALSLSLDLPRWHHGIAVQESHEGSRQCDIHEG